MQQHAHESAVALLLPLPRAASNQQPPLPAPFRTVSHAERFSALPAAAADMGKGHGQASTKRAAAGLSAAAHCTPMPCCLCPWLVQRLFIIACHNITGAWGRFLCSLRHSQSFQLLTIWDDNFSV